MEKLDLLDQNMFNFVALTSKIFSDLVKNVVDSDNMSLKAKEIVQLSRNIEQDIKNFDLDKEKPEELDLEFERLRLIKFEKLEEFDQIRREAGIFFFEQYPFILLLNFEQNINNYR